MQPSTPLKELPALNTTQGLSPSTKPGQYHFKRHLGATTLNTSPGITTLNTMDYRPQHLLKATTLNTSLRLPPLTALQAYHPQHHPGDFTPFSQFSPSARAPGPPPARSHIPRAKVVDHTGFHPRQIEWKMEIGVSL